MRDHINDLFGAVLFFVALSAANWLYTLVQSLPIHH